MAVLTEPVWHCRAAAYAGLMRGSSASRRSSASWRGGRGCAWRVLVGIRAPWRGQAHLAARLVAELAARGTPTALLPMDGFHLPQAELVRLGRRDRMGAADTFDVRGHVAARRGARRRGRVRARLRPGRRSRCLTPWRSPRRPRRRHRGIWPLLPEEGWGRSRACSTCGCSSRSTTPSVSAPGRPARRAANPEAAESGSRAPTRRTRAGSRPPRPEPMRSSARWSSERRRPAPPSA